MRSQVHCRYCGSFFYKHENDATSCSYHPKLCVHIGDAGSRADHADLWTFPCCGKTVLGDIVEGGDVTPEQTPGCTVGPHLQETGWRVFISYARSDGGIAGHLEGELRRRGHRAWLDRSDIAPASDWADGVEQAIAAAEHFVLLLTPRAVASREVNRELGLALEARKNVVPILIEGPAIPEAIQHINCLDWRSTSRASMSHSGFNQLRQAVVFGPYGLRARADEVGPSGGEADEVAPSGGEADRPSPRPAPRQTVLLKDSDGENFAEIHPMKRYEWLEGHLASVDGVVYVVVDVLVRSPSSVEVRVERARVPVDRSASSQ